MNDTRSDWAEYHRAALEKFEVPPLVQQLERFLPRSGSVIDLGSSVGRALPPLLAKGLSVTAVDADPLALELLRSRLPEGAEVQTIRSRFEDLALGTYDVVIANYSLFFLTPEEYPSFWSRLVGSIVPGGLFAVVFLGPNDDWRDRGYTIHSKAEVEKLLEPFEILHFLEEDADGDTMTSGQKHWHVFRAIGRKRR